MYVYYIEMYIYHIEKYILYIKVMQAWTAPEGSRRLRLRDFKTVGT
jgi:hypothetical protein